MTKILRHKNVQDILFVVLFFIVFIISVSRINYGFGGYDEPFYLTIPHRLSMGDALFKDEWDLSQMAGFLLFPLVKIFLRINGGTTGIVLAFRWMYLIFHGLVSIFTYIRFRKYGFFAAVGCAFYFFYIPYNIAAFSYNTMALDFLVLSAVFLSTFDLKKPIYAVLAGLCFAVTVLCCPYLLAVYVLYGIVLAAKMIKKNNVSPIFTGRVFLFFSVGAAALAVIFFIFVFSRMGIGELLPNIKIMLVNPEYTDQSVSTKFAYYIKQIKTCHKYFPYILMAYAAILVIMLVDRKRDEHKMIYFLTSAVFTVLCYILFIPMLTGVYFNGVGMPLIFMGLTAYILCKEKPFDIFYSIFIIGILYSFCANMASNTGIFAIEHALSLAAFASFLLIGQFLSEEFQSKRQKKNSIAVTIIVIVFLAILQFRVKTEYYYKEYESTGGKEFLIHEMEGGPADGIISSYEIVADYQMLLWNVNEFMMNHPTRDNLLILSEKPWLYLMFNDYPYATFSAWIPAENDATLDRLREYYAVNPDKMPKYIFVPKKSKWTMYGVFDDAKKYGYEVKENEYTWQFERVQNNNL